MSSLQATGIRKNAKKFSNTIGLEGYVHTMTCPVFALVLRVLAYLPYDVNMGYVLFYAGKVYFVLIFSGIGVRNRIFKAVGEKNELWGHEYGARSLLRLFRVKRRAGATIRAPS